MVSRPKPSLRAQRGAAGARHRPLEASDPDAERHANNLELFLDLVFVLAVTQIATLIGGDLSRNGVLKGVLVTGLTWWLWSQFTWAGAAVDLQRRTASRVLVLVSIPVTLTLAVALPEAYSEGGPWFGLSYLVVQILVLGMHASVAATSAATRTAFVRYAAFAAVAPVVVAIGGFLHGDARVVAWCVAAGAFVVGALRGAGAGEWTINPVHFAERHSLFVIISLGEVLVAVGATATNDGLDRRTFAALVAASSVACVIWWTYFAFIPDVAEHMLKMRTSHDRGPLARDLYTFGHLPIVVGIVLYAVVAKHVIAHPTRGLPVADRWALAAAVTAILAGYLHIQWRVVRRLAIERFGAAALTAGLCGLGARLAGAAVIGIVAAVLALMQSITWRRFRRGALASVSSNL